MYLYTMWKVGKYLHVHVVPYCACSRIGVSGIHVSNQQWRLCDYGRWVAGSWGGWWLGVVAGLHVNAGFDQHAPGSAQLAAGGDARGKGRRCGGAIRAGRRAAASAAALIR